MATVDEKAASEGDEAEKRIAFRGGGRLTLCLGRHRREGAQRMFFSSGLSHGATKARRAHKLPHSIGYRPEIDGLRAVAVLAVVLYHSGFSFVPGGFVGVDIFFVISGYLITSIIWREVSEGRFRFSTFYERRIRRLIPPLIPVLTVTCVGAFVLLSHIQFEDFIRSLQATLVFSANWHFLSTVGYFDIESDLKPLLHMWSLGVEEQYYLVFPMMLLALSRFRRALPSILLLLLIGSFTLASWSLRQGFAEAAFFNSIARFWELLVGSLLAFSARQPQNTVVASGLEAIAVTLILAPILLYGPHTPFPALAALPPVLGTALVILAGGNGRILSPVLKAKPMVSIGLISYGLYLWHWPLLVFLNVAFSEPPVLWTVAVVALAFALSILSYVTLERPIRIKAVLPSKAATYGLLICFTVTFLGASGATMLPPREVLVNHVRMALLDEERSAALSALDREEEFYRENYNLNFSGASPAEAATNMSDATCSFDGNNSVDRLWSAFLQKPHPTACL